MHYSLAIFALTVMVEANPVAFPQAVTAAIAPPEPAPPGCTPAYVGSFAIAAQNLSATAAPAKRDVAADPVCGQNATKVLAPVRQYIDGQIQGALHTETVTYQVPCPITQIGDGQIQNPVAPTPTPAERQANVPVVAEAGDAQVVASPTPSTSSTETPAPIPSSSPTFSTKTPAPIPSPTPTSSTKAAPIPSPTSSASSTKTPAPIPPPTGPPVPPSPVVSSASSTTGDASASRPTLGSNGLESCAEGGALAITLEDGVLKDQQGRTGYIAANYQFQFDGPPQAGAIITAGFSVCANGSLALGGSNVFYQCLSGSFYNLYDRYWAAQCSPVTIDTINLKQC